MDSTKRFSNRVEDYVRYRPHYPVEIIQYLQQQHGLTTDKLIADIGAGTGISSELFLQAGYRVIGVEPNKEMREKAITQLSKFPGFKALDGVAENTNLPDKTVDAIIAGQAFHWFDAKKTRLEFKKKLRNGGIVVLMWNERQISSGFEKKYDELITKHARDYVQVAHRNISKENIADFFAPHPLQLRTFSNRQVFGLGGLRGRLLSSSYMPTANDMGFEAMINELEDLFSRFQENGLITIEYATKIYSGEL